MSASYEHIFWDWNGTLFNDVALCHSIANTLLREQALPEQTLEEYRSRFDFPVVRYYERAGFDFGRVSFEALSVRFIEAYEARRHECALYVEAVEVLGKLVGEKTLSILSAYKQDTLETLVAEHGLSGYFAAIQGHGDIYAEGKEASARALVERLGAKAQRTLVVGDTLHDLAVARGIGADCVLVAHGHQDEKRLRASDTPVVESLGEVQAWVLQVL